MLLQCRGLLSSLASSNLKCQERVVRFVNTCSSLKKKGECQSQSSPVSVGTQTLRQLQWGWQLRSCIPKFFANMILHAAISCPRMDFMTGMTVF